jgi:hypothetical protein
MSLEQHLEVGRKLREFKNAEGGLSSLLWTIVCNSYPRSGPRARPVRYAESVLRGVDRLCCELEDRFCEEHRESFSTRVYYGEVDSEKET